MQALKIEETENSPRVILDPGGNVFEISGESRPEDVRKFYEPILNWIEEFGNELASSSEQRQLQFNFVFEYFNSSSAKYIMDIMSKINDIQVSNSSVDVQICWHYEEMDEDMLEAGEEFQNITEIPFKFVVIED